MSVVSVVTADDFKHLVKSTEIRGHDSDPARFRDPAGRVWNALYWFGEDYAALLLARWFILAIGQEGWTGYIEGTGWTILTDYLPPSEG
jgi:hypothetical protein